MFYYGTRLSPNMVMRPEGYLICRNVPIARAGVQEYKVSELDPDGKEIDLDGDALVKVYRDPRDVFSTAAMASFEGMPFTDDHPEDPVNITNVHYLGKGHAQNIRRVKDVLIADLVIQDENTINEIRRGKREISCGYNFNLERVGNKFYQRDIRGNHVALVDRGRAGHSVCIKDSKPERSLTRMDKKNAILARMFASFVKDEDTSKEDMEEAAETIADLTEENPEEIPGEIPGEIPEEEAHDEAPTDMNDVLALLAQIMEMIKSKAAPTQSLDDLVNETEEPEAPAEEESEFVSPEKINEEDEEPSEEVSFPVEMVKGAVDAIKPFIASLPPEQQKVASDTAANILRARMKKGGNEYASIKTRAKDSSPSHADLGERIMKARNINYKK